MNKNLSAAVEALGEIILQQKDQLMYKDLEIELKTKELEELKAKIIAIETHIDSYTSNVS